jgi:hypothetical protein
LRWVPPGGYGTLNKLLEAISWAWICRVSPAPLRDLGYHETVNLCACQRRCALPVSL